VLALVSKMCFSVLALKQIQSSVFCIYEEIAGGRSAPPPCWGAHNASQTSKLDPRRLASVALEPYDSCLWRWSWIVVPKLWSP